MEQIINVQQGCRAPLLTVTGSHAADAPVGQRTGRISLLLADPSRTDKSNYRLAVMHTPR